MKDLPQKFIVEKKTIAELRAEARERGYMNIWKLRRSELLELLYPSTDENDQDDDHTGKHDNPKERKGEDVRV